MSAPRIIANNASKHADLVPLIIAKDTLSFVDKLLELIDVGIEGKDAKLVKALLKQHDADISNRVESTGGNVYQILALFAVAANLPQVLDRIETLRPYALNYENLATDTQDQIHKERFAAFNADQVEFLKNCREEQDRGVFTLFHEKIKTAALSQDVKTLKLYLSVAINIDEPDLATRKTPAQSLYDEAYSTQRIEEDLQRYLNAIELLKNFGASNTYILVAAFKHKHHVEFLKNNTVYDFFPFMVEVFKAVGTDLKADLGRMFEKFFEWDIASRETMTYTPQQITIDIAEGDLQISKIVITALVERRNFVHLLEGLELYPEWVNYAGVLLVLHDQTEAAYTLIQMYPLIDISDIYTQALVSGHLPFAEKLRQEFKVQLNGASQFVKPSCTYEEVKIKFSTLLSTIGGDQDIVTLGDQSYKVKDQLSKWFHASGLWSVHDYTSRIKSHNISLANLRESNLDRWLAIKQLSAVQSYVSYATGLHYRYVSKFVDSLPNSLVKIYAGINLDETQFEGSSEELSRVALSGYRPSFANLNLNGTNLKVMRSLEIHHCFSAADYHMGIDVVQILAHAMASLNCNNFYRVESLRSKFGIDIDTMIKMAYQSKEYLEYLKSEKRRVAQEEKARRETIRSERTAKLEECKDLFAAQNKAVFLKEVLPDTPEQKKQNQLLDKLRKIYSSDRFNVIFNEAGAIEITALNMHNNFMQEAFKNWKEWRIQQKPNRVPKGATVLFEGGLNLLHTFFVTNNQTERLLREKLEAAFKKYPEVIVQSSAAVKPPRSRNRKKNADVAEAANVHLQASAELPFSKRDTSNVNKDVWANALNQHLFLDNLTDSFETSWNDNFNGFAIDKNALKSSWLIREVNGSHTAKSRCDMSLEIFNEVILKKLKTLMRDEIEIVECNEFIILTPKITVPIQDLKVLQKQAFKELNTQTSKEEQWAGILFNLPAPALRRTTSLFPMPRQVVGTTALADSPNRVVRAAPPTATLGLMPVKEMLSLIRDKDKQTLKHLIKDILALGNEDNTKVNFFAYSAKVQTLCICLKKVNPIFKHYRDVIRHASDRLILIENRRQFFRAVNAFMQMFAEALGLQPATPTPTVGMNLFQQPNESDITAGFVGFLDEFQGDIASRSLDLRDKKSKVALANWEADLHEALDKVNLEIENPASKYSREMLDLASIQINSLIRDSMELYADTGHAIRPFALLPRVQSVASMRA